MSKYHGKEEVFVDSVRLCGDFSPRALKKACVMVRVQVIDFLYTYIFNLLENFNCKQSWHSGTNGHINLYIGHSVVLNAMRTRGVNYFCFLALVTRQKCGVEFHPHLLTPRKFGGA